MYYKEFPVMFDWLHNGEGLTLFDLQGLADPNDARFQARVRRFAGFYIDDDPEAPNYDSAHKIIRSMFNGSRGPLLRKATAVDWAGDPIEVGDRFKPLHGEHNYAQMLAHFEKYNDIVGDNPMNLEATSLAFNAYALAQDPKYKNWLLEYVDAWVDRTRANDDIIPTNVGLDGVIGSGAGGKWYGGVYGWGFTVLDPATGKMANRNQHHLALTGFGNAFLLTGNRKYVDVWRKQIDAVNANGRQHRRPDDVSDDVRRRRLVRLHSEEVFARRTQRLVLVDGSSRPRTRWATTAGSISSTAKTPITPSGRSPRNSSTIRGHIVGLRSDRTTPQTRLADDPLAYNPATVYALVNLMLGGLYPGHVGSPLHCRVRYFDPEKHRAGVPDDVAALVDRLTDTQTGITLVNLNPVAGHSVIVQGGAYGEHQFADVTVDGQKRTRSTLRHSPSSWPPAAAPARADHAALRQSAHNQVPLGPGTSGKSGGDAPCEVTRADALEPDNSTRFASGTLRSIAARARFNHRPHSSRIPLSAVATSSSVWRRILSGSGTSRISQGHWWASAICSRIVLRRPLLETGRSKCQTARATPCSASNPPINSAAGIVS